MFLSDSKLYIRQALHNIFNPSIHKHLLFNHLKTSDSRLFFIISGKGILKIDGKDYPFNADTVVLFKAGTTYEWQTDNCDYFSINFDYNERFSYLKKPLHPFPADMKEGTITYDCGEIEDYPALNNPIVIPNATHLKRSIENIVTECAFNDDYTGEIRHLLITRTIYEILRLNNYIKQTGEIKNNSPIIKKIIEYVYSHYSENISNSVIADIFNYNPTYIGRIFKNYTGTSLHGFIMDYRIQIAKELLYNRAISIDEVCKSVGFNNYYHFSKMFKVKTGQTPTQYRKNIKINFKGEENV